MVTFLQCNFNYESSIEKVASTNLKILETFKQTWPEVKIGLSDHQKIMAPVLGAVAKGGTVIERRFSDDISRDGADHQVVLGPKDWQLVVL